MDLQGYSERELAVMIAESMSSFQVDKQYGDNNNKLKNSIDINQFRDSLDSISDDEYELIDDMVENAGIKDIHELYCSGKLSCEKLVIYYLKRIEKYDVNNLNSILELNPDVIQIARQKDADSAKGKLFGIPVLLKGNIDTGDKMHTTAGAYVLKDHIAKVDAHVVSKLRNEGAIILGKANLSEFANYKALMGPNGYSVLGGQTKNPYGKFDVGGSSSGSAVSVACSFATISIGTETSGSMIYPCSQNSVVGIKPTNELVKNDGVIPIVDVYDVCGPVAKCVYDAATVLSVICDKAVDYSDVLGQTSLEGKKIGVVKGMLARSEEDDIFDAVCKDLEKLGAKLIEVALDQAQVQAVTAMDVLPKGFEYSMNKYLENADIPGISTLKDISVASEVDLENMCPYGQMLIEGSLDKGDSVDEYYSLFDENKKKAKDILDKILEDVDVVITTNQGLTPLYPAAQYPAITLPCGYKSTNEPVGLTIVAGSLDEGKIIQVANAYEVSTKHRINPSL